MGMRPEKKTEFADQLEKLFNEFSAHFKDFKSHQHLFEIFFSSFHTDIDKAPTDIQMKLIDLQERTDLKAKYVEMNLGDFYKASINTYNTYKHLKVNLNRVVQKKSQVHISH